MLSKAFFALAVLAVGAIAQGTDTSSAAEPSASLPAGVTPCILGCIQPAAEAAGCSFTDATCVCSSAQFQDQATQCLTSTCSADDVQAALALQAQQCGAIGTSVSGSVSGSTTTADSQTTSAPTTTAAGTTSAPQTTTRATSTTPTSSRPTTSASGTTSAPANTSNAAVGREGPMGFVGLVVAGVFGLVL
ncbi:hypothetical protein H0H87_003356 [Tephrocybe sp. NHM501043]|nr:hypothetical protein H0H87_003356 [Tephrocybe sp. NHM501043]